MFMVCLKVLMATSYISLSWSWIKISSLFLLYLKNYAIINTKPGGKSITYHDSYQRKWVYSRNKLEKIKLKETLLSIESVY